MLLEDVAHLLDTQKSSACLSSATADWWASSAAGICCRRSHPGCPLRRLRRTTKHPRCFLRGSCTAALGGWCRAVNAVVADGVVHLWGTPPDDALRQAFVVAAESVPGVKAVEDHMDHPRVVDPIDLPNWPAPARP